jgi:hypothetical protein
MFGFGSLYTTDVEEVVNIFQAHRVIEWVDFSNKTG